MKFESKRSSLLEALQIAQNAIPNKTTLQVLNNFLFNLEGNMLEVTATDLDLGIIIRLEVGGQQDGAIVVNAKKFLEVIRELPDLPVVCHVEEERMTIQSGDNFQCHIMGYDSSEYPTISEESEGETTELDLKHLKFLFTNTSFAVSTDFSTRVSLTGVYWEYHEGKLEMVGTDGHRLGKAWVDIPEFNLKQGIILPPRAMNQILKVAGSSEGPLQVSLGDANVQFKCGNVTIISKCIEGPYPEYEKVIPTELGKTIQVNREELISVLRRVATMAHSKTKQVKFTFENDVLYLSARNIDMGGETSDSLPIQYSGDVVKVGYNATYVVEVLRLITTEDVTIKFNSNLGATIFEPSVDETNCFFIVMPLRLLDDE